MAEYFQVKKLMRICAVRLETSCSLAASSLISGIKSRDQSRRIELPDGTNLNRSAGRHDDESSDDEGLYSCCFY